MIDLNLTITDVEGDTQQVAVTPKAQVAFERHFNIGLGRAFEQEQRIEHLYRLGWEACKAAGIKVKPFDAWLDGIAAIEIEGGDPLDDESQ